MCGNSLCMYDAAGTSGTKGSDLGISKVIVWDSDPRFLEHLRPFSLLTRLRIPTSLDHICKCAS
jgi:hypothetical protein